MGTKQHPGLAMTLLGDPRLILLDEPTNGLDPAGVAEIRQLIVALARQEGVTVIVSCCPLFRVRTANSGIRCSW